mgnify:CR=1 FL=1
MIVHFTTVHPRHDTRIRVKEVATLSARFESITLLVQDGKGDSLECDGRVRIIDVGAPRGRFLRAVRGSWRMWRAIRRIRPEIAHFHDPELIPVGLLLKFAGCKVIYDVHEDVAGSIRAKYWIPSLLRWPVAGLARLVESLGAMFFDGIVAATPPIAKQFPQHKAVLVQNFPLLEELVGATRVPFEQRPPHAVYVGGLTTIRSAHEIVEATSKVPENCGFRLRLAGSIAPPSLEQKLKAKKGWERIDHCGWLNRREVAELLAQARVGLVLFHPAPNHTESQPNKLFEYMSAGIPVIASDFPLWRKIVEGAGCGILVDPKDPQAIADAMEWMIHNPQETEEMGRRGRAAVEREYNWPREGEKLVQFYARLLRGEEAGAHA